MPWAPDYITDTQLKGYVRIPDVVDDAEVASAITASSRAIDRHCYRQFGVVGAPEVRRYSAWWNRRLCRWVVDIDDLMTTAGIGAQILGVGVLDAYELEPINAAQIGRPWERLMVKPESAAGPSGVPYEVSITAKWGWSAVPGAVVQAAKLQGSRILARRDSPYGIAGSPDQGSELRLLAKLDPDVAVSLGDYVRPRGLG